MWLEFLHQASTTPNQGNNMTTTTTRREINGLKQYKGFIRHADGSLASQTEFSDWFADDEAAKVGYEEILREQGYNVLAVEIGFPCYVTVGA